MTLTVQVYQIAIKYAVFDTLHCCFYNGVHHII